MFFFFAKDSLKSILQFRIRKNVICERKVCLPAADAIASSRLHHFNIKFKKLKTKFKKLKTKFEKIKSKFKNRNFKFKKLKSKFKNSNSKFKKLKSEFKKR